MPIKYVFWLLMILWFLFGFWVDSVPAPNRGPFHNWGGNLLLFALIAILGYVVFSGGPITR